MIVVRDEFQLRFGRAHEALVLIEEGREVMRRHPALRDARILTDLTGEYYRLVLETTYANLGAYETEMRQGMNDPAWRAWYARFTPLVERGRREIFTIVGVDAPPLRALSTEAVATA